MNEPSVVDSLLQCIQHKARVGYPADTPTHDIAGVYIYHECNVDEPRSGRDIREVGDPRHVRRRRTPAYRPKCRLFADVGRLPGYSAQGCECGPAEGVGTNIISGEPSLS